MPKQIFSTIKVITIALALSFGLSFVYAWVAPTATPPGANVAAPVTGSGLTNRMPVWVTGGTIGSSGILQNPTTGDVTISGLNINMANSVNTKLYGDGTNMAVRTSGLFAVQNAAGTGWANGYAQDFCALVGGAWKCLSTAGGVSSVNGMTGAVTVAGVAPAYNGVGDIKIFTTSLSNGTGNPYVEGTTYYIDTIRANFGSGLPLLWYQTYQANQNGTYWRATAFITGGSGGSRGRSIWQWIFTRVS